jgi:hypothetical protein
MDKIIFYGKVKLVNGKPVIELHNREAVSQQVFEALGECNIRVVFSEDSTGREDWLNRYYWGHVIPQIRRGCTDAGHDWDNNEVHDFLKRQYTPTGSIKPLTKRQFRTYVDRCIQFAAEFLSVTIENTDTFAQKNFPQHEPGRDFTGNN